jgi:hypothetical protein
MKPTIGRTVIFHCDPYTDQQLHGSGQPGNGISCSPDLPAVVVHVWSETCVNLKVFTDGPDDIWVTSVTEGTGMRQWSWPERS